jgi:PHS family inorganic phosphate transporter-like MFS transporter
VLDLMLETDNSDNSDDGGGEVTPTLRGKDGGHLAIITVVGFKHQIQHDDLSYKHVDYCWRILIGFGCVPGALALYFRLTIPETPRYTMDIERNVKQASQDVDTYLTTGTFVVDPDAPVQRVEAPKASKRDFFRHYGQWKNGKILLGCAWSWFALDVAF